MEQINLLIDRHHQIIQRNLIERKDLTKDNFYKLFIKMKSNIKSLSNDLQVRSYIKKFYGSKIPEKYSYVLSLANKFLKLARLNFA